MVSFPIPCSMTFTGRCGPGSERDSGRMPMNDSKGFPVICMLVELVLGAEMDLCYLRSGHLCQCPEQLSDLEPGTEDSFKAWTTASVCTREAAGDPLWHQEGGFLALCSTFKSSQADASHTPLCVRHHLIYTWSTWLRIKLTRFQSILHFFGLWDMSISPPPFCLHF